MPEDTQLEIPVTPAPAEPVTPAEKLYADQGKPPATPAPAAPATPEEPEAKPVEAAPEIKVPEKYELKLPEGSRLDATFLEKIAADAKARGFSQEQAAKYFEENHKVVNEYVDSVHANFQKEKDSWADAVRKDPEIGGKNFKETVFYAERAFKTFGSEKLQNILNETGYGDHPELVRWAAKVGKMISEDKHVGGGEIVKTKKSAAEILYGNPAEKTN